MKYLVCLLTSLTGMSGTAAAVAELPPYHPLALCVKQMYSKKFTSAWELAKNRCVNEKESWDASCVARYKGPGTTETARHKCELELREVLSVLDRPAEAPRADAPKPAPSEKPVDRSSPMAAALDDLRQGRELPNLPQLDRPVYVAPDSMVCTSQGALANPNIERLILTGTCSVVRQAQRVSVVLPVEQRDYIMGHFYGTVRVVWTSGTVSVANGRSAWVRISDLRN